MTAEERRDQIERHQAMLAWHRLRKALRAERHREKWHKMNWPPITYK